MGGKLTSLSVNFQLPLLPFVMSGKALEKERDPEVRQ